MKTATTIIAAALLLSGCATTPPANCGLFGSDDAAENARCDAEYTRAYYGPMLPVGVGLVVDTPEDISEHCRKLVGQGGLDGCAVWGDGCGCEVRREWVWIRPMSSMAPVNLRVNVSRAMCTECAPTIGEAVAKMKALDKPPTRPKAPPTPPPTVEYMDRNSAFIWQGLRVPQPSGSIRD